MQRIKPPFLDSRPSLNSQQPSSHLSFDYQQCFTAWDQSEPAHISLKFLQSNLSLLQRQYQTLRRSSKLTLKQQLSFPVQLSLPTQLSLTTHLSLPKQELITASKSNCKFLPKLLNQTKLTLMQAKQQKSTPVLKVKTINLQKARAEFVEKQIVAAQRKRVGSQFRDLRGCFPLEAAEADVFLQKNKRFNISRLINLNKIRGRASTKLTCYKSDQKQNVANLLTKTKLLQNSIT